MGTNNFHNSNNEFAVSSKKRLSVVLDPAWKAITKQVLVYLYIKIPSMQHLTQVLLKTYKTNKT
jgi:hypothetical protein